MDHKKIQNSTPSARRNLLVEKVRNSNINCDSPFRLLPNISTPPSRLFKIRNPFESPLLDRLHLPICSPGLFKKTTPKKQENFKWTICDISNLKPAEIDTNCYQEISTKLDPQTESLIQDRISTFFRLNAVVPSPAPRENNERKCSLSQEKSDRDSLGIKVLEGENDCVQPNFMDKSNGAMDVSETSDGEAEYLPEDEYYKKLFDFESKTPQTSPSISPMDSPVQFSPPKELIAKSFSDEMDRKMFKECGLSPITPENETSQKDNSKNSTRESKSVCRLIFSDNSFEIKDVKKSFSEHSFEATVRESKLDSDDIFNENSGIMSIDEPLEENECEEMEISLINTPKTGIFTSQRKRLSDSFKDLDSMFGETGELRESKLSAVEVKSRLLSEGSSDMGYYSTNTAPSISENTWNSSHVFSSTPTKRKK